MAFKGVNVDAARCRPSPPAGDDKFWKISEDALVEALNGKGWKYGVDAGGGAFYGPKIDIKIQVRG